MLLVKPCLPFEKWKTYQERHEKRIEGSLSGDKRLLLIALSDEIEMLNVQRIEKLSLLANLRGISL